MTELAEPVGCGCTTDEDELILTLCSPHEASAIVFEARITRLLDAEFDGVIRELAGRAPKRLERKVGIVRGSSTERSRVNSVDNP